MMMMTKEAQRLKGRRQKVLTWSQEDVAAQEMSSFKKGRVSICVLLFHYHSCAVNDSYHLSTDWLGGYFSNISVVKEEGLKRITADIQVANWIAINNTLQCILFEDCFSKKMILLFSILRSFVFLLSFLWSCFAFLSWGSFLFRLDFTSHREVAKDVVFEGIRATDSLWSPRRSEFDDPFCELEKVFLLKMKSLCVQYSCLERFVWYPSVLTDVCITVPSLGVVNDVLLMEPLVYVKRCRSWSMSRSCNRLLSKSSRREDPLMRGSNSGMKCGMKKMWMSFNSCTCYSTTFEKKGRSQSCFLWMNRLQSSVNECSSVLPKCMWLPLLLSSICLQTLINVRE